MIVLFGVMALTSFRRQRYNWLRLVIPLAILGYFAFKYVRNVPDGGGNLYVLIGSIAMGIALGLIWVAVTRVTRHENETYLQGGVGSLIVLTCAFLLRVLPIEWMTHHPSQTMNFAMEHHVSIPSIVAPAFIFLTAAMVLVRLGIIVIRTASVTRRLQVE